jgi:hypothetical protein
MKNLLFVLLILAFVSCEAPYKIVETYTTDSTGKTVKTINKYYDNSPSTTYVPDASYNFYSTPLFHPYYNPYYRPIIIPKIVVPVAPRYNYNNYTPRYRRH